MSKTYESFEEYIVENYQDSISESLLACFKKNAMYADAEEYADPERYGLEIELQWELLKLAHFKAPDYQLDFDMYIRVMIEVTDYVGDELQTNFFEDRYTLKMSGELFHGLQHLKIEKLYSGNQMREFSHDNSLSEFLTPYINKNEYSKYATEFLKLYYPEALESACFVKPPVVFKRMGLQVVFAPMDEGINGKIIFTEEKLDIYNFDKDKIVTITANPGTIALNVELLSKERFGSLNNTAIHECVHWWLHRKYFQLVMLLNPNDPKVFIDEMNMPNNKKFKNKYFMELQARSIAPIILMPEETSRNTYETILNKLENRKSYHSKKKTYFYAMYKFAKVYGASVMSARIRLENLGYTEVSFASKLEGSKDIKPFKTSAELTRGQTYLVDFEDAVKAILSNQDLAPFFINGRFLYVNGLFILNDEKYVKQFKNGHLALTEDALGDVSKCCILFDTEAESVTVNYDPAKFNFATFCSGGSTNEYKRAVSARSDANERLLKIKAAGNRCKRELEEVEEYIESMNGYRKFNEKLDCLFGDECLGLRSNRHIASTSGISDKTIKTFRTGESKPDLKQLLAICSGLGLHPRVSLYLLTAAGYDLIHMEEEPYQYYLMLLMSYWKYGREAWNTMISEAYQDNLEYRL